jgi:hypothetical protein
MRAALTRFLTHTVGFTLLIAGSGCGDPIVTQVTPPGVEFKPVIAETDVAEARGEQMLRGSVAPKVSGLDLNIKPSPPTNPGEERTLENGLRYTTLQPGSGPDAGSGQTAKVHYVGTLMDGRQFDSSRELGRSPYEFQIGVSRVISGWHTGICGMKVGERRRLIIPPDLAYGTEGRPPAIPPNSTLVFDVELIDVR